MEVNTDSTDKQPTAGKRYGLSKADKLRHDNLTKALFAEGKSLYAYPLRLTVRRFSRNDLESMFRCGAPHQIGNVQFLISVPKRNLHRAVDRVLMRRRIREAWRLNCLPVRELATDCSMLSIAFVYMDGKTKPYADIEQAMLRLVEKLCRRLSEPQSDITPQQEQ